MTDPTPKQLAMARRIAADKLTRPEGWLPGVKAGIYEEIVAGEHDGEAIVQIALAAIIETSERAAKYADDEITRIYNRSPVGHGATTAMTLRNAYSKGDHLDD